LYFTGNWLLTCTLLKSRI